MGYGHLVEHKSSWENSLCGGNPKDAQGKEYVEVRGQGDQCLEDGCSGMGGRGERGGCI